MEPPPPLSVRPQRAFDYLLIVSTVHASSSSHGGGGSTSCETSSPPPKAFVSTKLPPLDYPERPIQPMLSDIPDFIFPAGAGGRERDPYSFSFVLTTQEYSNYYVSALVTFERTATGRTVLSKAVEEGAPAEDGAVLPKALCLV